MNNKLFNHGAVFKNRILANIFLIGSEHDRNRLISCTRSKVRLSLSNLLPESIEFDETFSFMFVSDSFIIQQMVDDQLADVS